jgi:hypothetical protein
MLIPLLVLATTVLLAPVQADTVVPVDRGTRLDVEAWRGAVNIGVWDRDAVRIRTGGRGERGFDLTRATAVLRVRQPSRGGDAAAADYTITVPRWMGVWVHGQQVEVTVRGTTAEIAVETVGGRVLIEGGGERVSVRTIHGPIAIRNARGRVDAWTANESVTLDAIVGDITVETTNGGITMRGVRSSNVRAATVNGSVSYEGSVADRGRYSLTTHNGSITMTVPEAANAAVSAATYHGSFRAGFPVRLTGMSRERHYDFTLGSGSARVEMESFNGDIILQRPVAGRP